MQINALLSSIAPARMRGFAVASGLPGAEALGGPAGGTGADVFVRGQWWKNQAEAAAATTFPEARSCACGNCPSCAARAYEGQSGQVLDAVSGSGFPQNEAAAAAPVLSGDPVSGEKTKDGQADDLEPGAVTMKEPGTLRGQDGEPLTQAEQQELAKLVTIDSKVKAHEMAHLLVAGPYVRGGANFQYAKGPDGKKYAVAGEVGIDVSKESSPEATISKMQTVRAAALAPADPSPQDRRVAARASMTMSEASRELQMARLDEARTDMTGLDKSVAGPEKSDEGVAKEESATSAGSGEGSASPLPPRSLSGQRAMLSLVSELQRPASRLHIAA